MLSSCYNYDIPGIANLASKPKLASKLVFLCRFAISQPQQYNLTSVRLELAEAYEMPRSLIQVERILNRQLTLVFVRNQPVEIQGIPATFQLTETIPAEVADITTRQGIRQLNVYPLETTEISIVKPPRKKYLEVEIIRKDTFGADRAIVNLYKIPIVPIGRICIPQITSLDEADIDMAIVTSLKIAFRHC